MMDKDIEKQLLVSVSPHIKDTVSVQKIMWTVSAALAPAVAGAVYNFGLRAVYVIMVCILASLISERFMQSVTGVNKSLSDGSAFLTGLLLGLNMPVSAPVYIPIVGSFVAIVIAKQLFGGLGYNVFNPALIGRAFVLITWPRAMTTWHAPMDSLWALDAKTTATPLGLLKEEGIGKLIEAFGDKTALYKSLLLGTHAGSLGETSVLAILIGGLYLLYKKYISWHIPLSYLATVALLAWALGGKTETGIALFTGDPLIHILSGGLMLGAFFMATDYVTVPSVKAGQIIFGIGCGLITMIIRLKGGFPEGVMFAILLMNCFTPLIDRSLKVMPFGFRKPVKKQ